VSVDSYLNAIRYYFTLFFREKDEPAKKSEPTATPPPPASPSPLNIRRHFPLEPIFQYLSTGGDL